jgi:hypothetical protein
MKPVTTDICSERVYPAIFTRQSDKRVAATLTLHTKKSPLHNAVGFLENLEQIDVLATASELVLELLDATSGIDETLLTSEGGVRIGSNIANYHLVINAIDCFSLATTHSRASQIFSACRNVDEGNRVELWMDISFHSIFRRFRAIPDAL